MIKFERDATGHIHLARSGWETWLDNFAEELIANKSFAELLRTSRNKVESSQDALAAYNRYPKAVELPGRYINVPGMQEVVIQIDWRHYDNKEIGAEMTRWAANNRPESEPEPDRTGRSGRAKSAPTSKRCPHYASGNCTGANPGSVSNTLRGSAATRAV